MARNEEKAQAMLNRWIKQKRMLHSRKVEIRPTLSDDCNSITKCENWRKQIIKEIVKKMSKIQNAGLGEHMIRQINDELNGLLKEKANWERRIKFLGGPDHITEKAQMFESHGQKLPGSGGYFYFGAAKDLPGVRELFQKKAPSAPKKSVQELYKNIDHGYYGVTGKEEEDLLKEEKAFEDQMKQEAVKD